MKNILILIDLKSIKKNPNAYSRSSVIMGAKEIRFTVKGKFLPECLVDGVNCFVEEQYFGDSPSIKGTLLDHTVIDLLIKEKVSGVEAIVKNNLQTIHHLPEEPYFYKYVNTKVKCKECGHAFMSGEFLSLDNGDDESFAFTYTGCPKCKAYDCCNVEYEKIEIALARKKTK